MRLNWCDDEDFPGQFGLWQGNCQRSLRSTKGQVFLRRVEAALVAMPDKRLIREALIEPSGDVCAIGAVAKHEGRVLDWDIDYDVEDFGIEIGAPRLVAWKLVEINDIQNDATYEYALGPNRRPWDGAGYSVRVPVTAEQRYENVLAWVRKELLPVETPETQR